MGSLDPRFLHYAYSELDWYERRIHQGCRFSKAIRISFSIYEEYDFHNTTEDKNIPGVVVAEFHIVQTGIIRSALENIRDFVGYY